MNGSVNLEKHTLSRIFLSVYKNLSNFNSNRNKYFYVENFELLETSLEHYIFQVMGFSVINQYNNYKLGRISDFEYFGEIAKYFENIINNGDFKSFDSLIKWVNHYADSFLNEIDKYPYSSAFIKASQKSLCTDWCKAVINHRGNSYSLTIINERDKEPVPAIIIEDIEKFEKILEDYIETIKNTDTYFNRPFFELLDSEENMAVQYVLEWTLKNATSTDLSNVEYFFKKFTDFLLDDTFDNYKIHPKKIGDLFGDELYLLQKKSTVAYETPFYLSFMLKNRRIELPNIRMGIEMVNGNKTAHVLATQSSQDMVSKEREHEIADLAKKMLPKSKYFREYNPSHLVSITLALGFLNGYGVKNIVIPDYLPLRYQRFVLEGRKNDEELSNYQYRLTNKFFNTFFRLFEMVDGIEIQSMPEMGMPLKIVLDDNIIFNNEFLQNIYNIGYKNAIMTKDDNERLTM